jgi:Beta-ketoacyl synthase, N-terminal domain
MSQPTSLPSKALAVDLASVAFWSDAVPTWSDLRDVLLGHTTLSDEAQAATRGTTAAKPLTSLLTTAERRRAPDTLILALHVAELAVQSSCFHPASMPSVFASAHGDVGLTGELCDTLAQDPSALSPTKFIHSVHNAASGAWGLATGCTQPSLAVAGHRCTFALGLLEAAAQCVTQQQPVLLVAYDVQTRGTIAQLTSSEGRMAMAMVLKPSAASPALSLAVVPKPAQLHVPASMKVLAGNALADALPFLHAWAHALKGHPAVQGHPAVLTLPLHAQCSLHITLQAPPSTVTAATAPSPP